MPSKLDDLVFQVEAVLFASGKPLAVKEIADALSLEDYRPVQRAVRTLEQTYGNRQSALEVRRVGDRYALQLQEKFVPTVHSVTPVEMTARTLRTRRSADLTPTRKSRTAACWARTPSPPSPISRWGFSIRSRRARGIPISPSTSPTSVFMSRTRFKPRGA